MKLTNKDIFKRRMQSKIIFLLSVIILYDFLDMAQCLDASADREEAVVSVPETLQITSNFGRQIDLDVSTPTSQYRQRLFPVALLFDIPGFMAWESGFSAHHQFDAQATTQIGRASCRERV